MDVANNSENNYESAKSIEKSLPIISHIGRDTFEYSEKKYLSQPSIEEFLVESGIKNIRIFRGIIRELRSQGINSIEDMVNVNKSQILQLDSSDRDISNKIFTHLVRIKHKGPIVLRSNDLEKLESEYYYLEFEKDIDTILFRHSNGKHGIRSKSIIELCGDEGTGKTQWCLTAACSMLQVGRRVVYIDSEGGFDYHRIKEIGEQSNLSQRSIKDNIILAKIDSFDELDLVLDQLSPQMQKQNIGMIIIDSIMQLLQNTYPVDSDMNNLAERQLHLRKTMRRLRLMARFHNLIIIYTNHTRETRHSIIQDINQDTIEVGDDLKTVIGLLKRLVVNQIPMGGQTLAHSSDIRIYLTQNINRQDMLRNKFIAILTNCSYLPQASIEYEISTNGIRKIVEENQLLSDTESTREYRDELDDLLS